jgi:methionine-rich copper-binding protein CopC
MGPGERVNRPVLRSWRRIGVIAFTTAALVALTAGPSSAHSQIISTSPEDGAILASPPTEVRITFDAPLLDDTDTISVNDADGNVVFSTHPRPDGASVAIPWPAGTKPGQYQVAYRIVCGDGHPEIGALKVTINASGAGSSVASTVAVPATSTNAPATTASQTPAAAGSALPLVIAAAVLFGATVAVVGVLAARRRKPEASR